MKKNKPNILFVFADQMSANHVRCYGNDSIITPNLDNLANESIFCVNAVSNCPICSPNRATMLTGTYPTTHKVLFNDLQVRTDLPSIASVANENGYLTAYIGKWHIDGGGREKWIPPGPRRLGFKDFWAVYNCHHEYFDPKYYVNDSPSLVRRDGYEPEVQTELAIDFMKNASATDKPFLLVVSFGPPHNSYELVPRKYKNRYDIEKIRFRSNCMSIPEECLDPVWEQRETTRDFYALVASLDDMVGLMLQTLKDLNIEENTIVVFTSDHGDMLWSHGLLYKCVPYKESALVPLFIRYPGAITCPRKIYNPISSVDLLPTLAGLTGWDCSYKFEGNDFSKYFCSSSPVEIPQEEVFFAMYNPYVFRNDFPVPEWRGIKTIKYTYTETTDRRTWLFFDDEADPYQMNNLAGNKDYEKLKVDLSRRLHSFLDKIGDPFLDKDGMIKSFNVGKGWEF